MAERVFLHVGLPKTATTYLQTILWGNREALGDAGRPAARARRRYEHLWASRIVREDPAFDEAPASTAAAPGSGCAPTSRQWPGTR